MSEGLTYASSGVDYDPVDRFKRLAQEAAAETDRNAEYLGFAVEKGTRGESAPLLLFNPSQSRPNTRLHFSSIEEGLGTKNMVADSMQQYYVGQANAPTFYDAMAQDTVAMIVNDLITMGVFPVSTAMHLAVADSAWFSNERRYEDLIRGWKNACDVARCIWLAGETPVLKGIIQPGTSLLSGSATGLMASIRPMDQSQVEPGDAIIMLTSSGVHANGLTLARKIAAERASEGYATPVDKGLTYGEALLKPTPIYVPAMWQALSVYGVHYAVNITGHGWRKIMRSTKELTYVIDRMPPQLPIFDFIQGHGVELREMYSTYNMGVGFVMFVDPDKADEIVGKIDRLNAGYTAFVAGRVEEGPRRVVIDPINIVFEGNTLQVR